MLINRLRLFFFFFFQGPENYSNGRQTTLPNKAISHLITSKQTEGLSSLPHEHFFLALLPNIFPADLILSGMTNSNTKLAQKVREYTPRTSLVWIKNSNSKCSMKTQDRCWWNSWPPSHSAECRFSSWQANSERLVLTSAKYFWNNPYKPVQRKHQFSLFAFFPFFYLLQSHNKQWI